MPELEDLSATELLAEAKHRAQHLVKAMDEALKRGTTIRFTVGLEQKEGETRPRQTLQSFTATTEIP